MRWVEKSGERMTGPIPLFSMHQRPAIPLSTPGFDIRCFVRLYAVSRSVIASSVVRGVSFADEQEAEAYFVADNRLVELGGLD